MKTELQIGQAAPDFSLFDQHNQKHNLSDFKGQWLLVYFYPKDDTPGCTQEACSLRDNFPKFKKLDIQILGISTDLIESHQKFALKYQLPFIILADPTKEVVQKYGVWQEKNMYGRKYFGTVRSSFLINPEGKIIKIYSKVKPKIHAQEVIADLMEIIS